MTGASCTVGVDSVGDDGKGDQNCGVNDVYCKPTGACPSGFTGGEFNGQAICVKNGQPISATPQPKSTLSPPTTADTNSPPSSFPPNPNGSPNVSEGLTPADRTVIGVGSGPTTVAPPGAGTGDGKPGRDPCGLPGTPPCKIDETGTPSGQGVDSEGRAAMDAHGTSVGNAITGVVGGSGAPTSSWGFSFNLPTHCQPFTVDMIYKVVDIDPCAFQAVIHDLMSLIWIGATIFFSLGMVFRTITGGGA
jgi:hypothetical protein